MDTFHTTESLFSEIKVLLKDLIDQKKTAFSIVESMMVIDMDYHENRFMTGLEEMGFYNMTPEEQMYLLLAANNIYENGLEPLDFGNFSKLKISDQLKAGKNRLLDRGILRAVAADADTGDRASTRHDRTMLSPYTCGKLFYGMTEVISYERMARQVEVIKACTIKEKPLFFTNENQKDIDRLIELVSPSRYREIMTRLEERGRKAAVSCLFYGSPGTGKTEFAKQLARMTGRDILIADVSKLHSSFTGDTEKNYREMFAGYRYIEKISENVPILLFNEADGILGKRGDVMRQAVDKIANRVQNLLLQEMEDFEGIFIGTTNLADNLDPAFERRLLYKIEFMKPDTCVRKKLWKSMMPELNEDEVEEFARKYDFTGGQIDNIATKRDIDYIIAGEMPDKAKIEEYCESERFEKQKQNRKIGFQTAAINCRVNEIKS